jgi:hypothetical protein
MVSNRRGSGNLGCLVTLLLFVAALYYGVHIGEVYVRYYRLLDAMQFQASIAPSVKDDAVINRRLMAAADSILGFAPDFRIARTPQPPRITIQTEYRDSVDLPFFKRAFPLHPRAEAPL